MGKFYGAVGFWDGEEEVRTGVTRPKIVERNYYGDILRSGNRWQDSSQQDAHFTLNNRISILSDPYAHEHWPAIKYIIYNGTKWQVESVEESYPRLILEIGGVYNGINGPSEIT